MCPTSDGYITFALPLSEPHFRFVLEKVGDPTPGDLTGGTKGFLDRIAARTGGATSAEWVEQFSAEDIPVGPVLSTAEHMRDPQTLAVGIYATLHDGEGPVVAP